MDLHFRLGPCSSVGIFAIGDPSWRIGMCEDKGGFADQGTL